jgi:cyclohexanecarboxylate-CoA ligase
MNRPMARRSGSVTVHIVLIECGGGPTVLYETILTREDADRYCATGWWPDRLLNDALAVAVARTPARTAIADTRGRMTYAAVQGQVEQCALGLLAIGIRHGDVVTAQLPNWNEFVVLTLALERIGAVVNPVAPIFRHHELRVMLRLAHSATAVIPEKFRGWDYPAMYAELKADLPDLKHVVVIDGDTDRPADGSLSWNQLLANGAPQSRTREMLDQFRPSPNDVSQIIFTSGTTGAPKGVLHTANTLGAQLEAVIDCHQLTAGDVFHMASTVGHQTGFLLGVRLPLYLGARAVYQEVWDPAEFIRLVDAEHVTFTAAATPFLADTLRAPGLADQDIRSLRIFMCGGAPIPRPLAQEAVTRLGCRIVPQWGLTEVGPVTTTYPDDPIERAITTDGRAYPQMELAVRDLAGRDCPPGQEGELHTRGAFMFAGYVQGRLFTEQSLTTDGWLITGDRAVMDEAGYIRITGRSKDIIIRGGENIPVKEIEDVLIQCPKVRSVALIGVPDPRLGEIGYACIIPEAGETFTLDEMRAFLAAQQVTRQFWPERLQLMDAFPATPSGKVQKFALRHQVHATQCAELVQHPSAAQR